MNTGKITSLKKISSVYGILNPMNKVWVLLFFIILFLIGFIITANVAHFDFDLWARLIAGMGVIDGGQVLKTDFLSYTPTHTWWDHEYGSGVVFYYLLKHFGAYSLIIFQAVLIFGIFFTITKIIKLRGVNSPYSFLFYLFALIALAENFGSPIRCHMFSFLLFTVFLYILELSRKGNYKVLYILPFLTVLWNNLHGGVVSGLGLIAMFAFAAILDGKPFKHYIISGLVSAAALVINPWGYEYIKFLLMANTMSREHVAEWWGLFSKFHLFRQIPFKVFMFLIVGFECAALIPVVKSGLKDFWSRIDKTKYIVLISTLFLSLIHIKLIPFFVIAGCAYCYEDFEKFVLSKMPHWTDKFICLLLLVITLFSLTVKRYDIPLGASAYPHREVEFIKVNKLTGNLLVNFGLGSFVSYKLYPQNLVYMDGRYEEVYYDDLVPLLDKFYVLKEGWDDVLKKYPPDIMIIEKYYPVYDMLNAHNDWTDVFESETFAVFVRSNDVKKSYILPSNDIQYYKDTLFDTSINF